MYFTIVYRKTGFEQDLVTTRFLNIQKIVFLPYCSRRRKNSKGSGRPFPGTIWELCDWRIQAKWRQKRRRESVCVQWAKIRKINAFGCLRWKYIGRYLKCWFKRSLWYLIFCTIFPCLTYCNVCVSVYYKKKQFFFFLLFFFIN